MPTPKKQYQFFNSKGESFYVDKDEYDQYSEDFAEQYPDASMRMVSPDGESWNIPVKNVKAAMNEGGYRMWELLRKTVVKQPKAQPKPRPEQPITPQEPVEEPAPQMETTQVPAAPTAPKAKSKSSGPYKPTDLEMMGFGMNIGNMRYTAENAAKGVEQIAQNAKSASPFGSGNVGLGSNKNLRKGEKAFDAEKGAFVDTYLTSDGRKFNDLYQANRAQEGIDIQNDNRHYRETMEELGIDWEAEQKKDNNKLLGDAYAELHRLEKAEQDERKKNLPSLRIGMLGDPLSGTTSDDVRKENGNLSNIQSAIRLVKRRITALEAIRDDAGFVGGTVDALTDPSAYTFGVSDLADSRAMADISKKIEQARAKGERPQLSESENLLVRNYMLNQQAQEKNSNRSDWYGYGQMLGTSLPFMAQFYLTGGFSGAAQAGTRLGTKAGLKMASSAIGRQMTKNIGGRLLLKTGQSVLKGTGRVGGAMAGGALQSNTIGAAKTASDIANRRIGQLSVGDDGRITFKDSEGMASAIIKGELSNIFENGSELLGPAFDFAPQYLARVIKNSATGRFMQRLSNNALWRSTNNVLKKFGIDGFFGEGMEEEANGIANAIIGESNWFKDPNDPNKPAFFDGKEQFDTWAGVVLTGAALRGPALAVQGYQSAEYYGNQYNLNQSDRRMRLALGNTERYNTIKAMLDGATNENIGNVVNDLMKRGQLEESEKREVMFYAQDLVKARGFNIGSIIAATQGAEQQPRVAGYNIKGNTVEEVDKDGNVLATHEYEDREAMKVGLYGLQQQRADLSLQSDIMVMKARPFNQYNALLQSYCEETGVSLPDLQAALDKPSVERTDAEQQAVLPFAQRLHDTVYDSSMLHEEQSRQDGEDIADADAIDIEEPSAEGANLRSAWLGAQESRRLLFERNEVIADEVLSRERDGVSPQEIIASLETASEEERQIVIDYYNQKARYEGYMNRMGQKIDEEARNSRERHTMKGKINGVADEVNVRTITDGTNRYYLVSGDITADPTTGRITDSSSGLIIGMDLDGSFVQLSEDDGYSLEPVTQTLDQYEEEERNRLGELLTFNQGVGDTTEEQVPEGQPEVNIGDETGVIGGTGAEGQPTTAPITTPPSNPPLPTGDQGGAQQPAVTIESVTDESGVKRYENGIPVDDAIADIQADGYDVNELADTSIAEAQQTIDNVNSKANKTRKDLMDKKRAQDIVDYYNSLKTRYAELNPPADHVPEYRYDTPQAARQRGFKIVEGQRIDRQQEQPMPQGMEVEVQYSTKDKVKGRLTVSELGDVQGSHLTNGQRNEKHFIPEAQPKAEFGADRQAAAQSNASEENFRPELMLTFNGVQSAYSGSTTQTNRRGEVIQGNGRRNLAEYIYAPGNEAVARRYKDFLKAHAAELGTTAEAIEQMEKPFAHIVLDVTDEEAIRLGQFTAQDLETGGKKIPEVSSTATKMGDKFGSFANVVLRHEDPDASLAERIEANVEEAVRWLNQGGYINNTEAKTLLEDKAAARQFVKDLLTDTLFSGASPDLRTMFYELPKNIQSAIVSVIGREATTSPETTILGDIQESIQAYHELVTSSPQFAGVRGRNQQERYRAADVAVSDWLRQINLDGSRNTEKYSNFALELAKLYRSLTDQKTLATRLRDYYDLVSGATRQLGMFDEPGTSGITTREEAIKQIFGVEYGRQRTVPVAGNNQGGQEGRGDGSDPNRGGEREEGEGRPSESGRGDTWDVAVGVEQEPQQPTQEQDESYGKDNTLVSQDRYEELKKRMRQKLLGQLNAGFDPEIISIGAEMAMFHVEAGARKFADFARRMIADLGDAIRPYLQGIYESAKRMPGMQELRKEMDPTEVVDAFDVDNFDKEKPNNAKGAAKTVNEHKNENNEPENVVSSQQKPASKLEGDSAEFAERQQKIGELTKRIAVALEGVVFREEGRLTLSNIKAMAKKAGVENISDTDLQELVETEVVKLARDIAETESLDEKQKFQMIVKLYEGQPSLNARDNDRINKQQYSTPAPMAFLMGKFLASGKQVESGLEPSAGNGMLTIGLPKEKMHVNDIDEMRLSNLQKQGYGEVTSQDGLQPFEEKAYDVVVTNPPFGSTAARDYDGWQVSGLEQQMAINALESMKDDGRAAIIIGGNTEYNQNGTIKGKDKAFFNYLYSHYHVVDVINLDGKSLYSRQGTGYPVRMILISGRKAPNAPMEFAPVMQKARAERVNSYDELYKRVNDDILSDSNKSAGVHDTESGESNGKHDNGHAGASSETGVRNVQPGRSSGQRQLLDSGGQPVSGGVGSTQRGTETRTDTSVGGRNDVVHGTGSTATQPSGGTSTQANLFGDIPDGRDDTKRPDGRVDVSVGAGQRGTGTTQQTEQPAVKRGLGTEKVPYRKQSGNPFTLQSLMPAEQADVVKKALEDLGDVDQFLVDELGYSSKEELHQALAAEQIDSVAMAIHQMNQGNAFIIGDQTGIGKGRQAAALIRYGVKKGGFPVFITVKKGLFSDMYRDLCDIGSPGLRPFIWSADDTEHSADVTDKDGNVVYKRPSDKEQKRVVDYINKYGKLPPEYDYIITTYDSFKGGTMVYEEGQKKARNFGKKSITTGARNSQAKRDALEVLAQNSYVIMDESHNAGGEGSAVSGYLQYITTKAKGVTFLSATFAKRPGNMPIYSLKTAISKAGVKIGELIDAVKRGGATFQEIMSKALTEAGQMIRRERDMTGVTIDWKGIEDESVVEKQRQQYDTIIGLFNDIIDFQRRYVDPIVNKKNDEAADEQGEVDHTPGTRDMGINNTPFASRTYNMVQQVLLSLKAEETAKRAIEHLKQGHKPVIALANTNEGAADEVSTGEDMEMPDLSVNLKKGLQGTLRITKKDAFGNNTNEMIPFDELSEAGQARYREIMDAIENASSGLSLSPIDVIKNELKKAGYKVGELTGRKQEFVYNEDGTVKRVKRQDSDKKRTAADFNNGKLDVLILNKSAGTGISLHASSKFDDQRQRVMIVAQAQGDVNDEVQIRGRIDRTGQVLRGMYEYVVSQIPSEQRLLMMLKAKLRSLDANTTSSQKSKFNEMQVQDIINKYGDDIVIQYLAEHPDLAIKMVDPLKWTQKFGEGFESMSAEALASDIGIERGEAGSIASKVLGRMALLKVAEQEKMLQEIGDLYQAEIDRLNEMGENDLEITEMPLRAKTLKKEVWEEGVEPGGKNPFADNSYVEEVEMDVLRKPMKAEEVKKSQARLLGDKTWGEYKQGALKKVDEWADEKKAETTKTITERAEKRANAEKEKYAKGAKKAQEKNGMTDEDIEKNAQFQYNNIYDEEMSKLQNALDAIDKQRQAFVDALETFSTEGVYALPSEIYDLSQMTFEPSFGKVIDIKLSENFSTTASTITFATLDGRRKVTIPISGMVKQNNGEKRDIKPVIVQLTAQVRNGMFGSNPANTQKVLEQNVDNWDRLTSTATRKKGYIITGNLLKALTELRKQGKGGKLISYTTDTGEIRQGVLMGDNFDPGALTSKNPISSAKADLDDWSKDRKIVSADKEVTVKKNGYGPWYQLKVPKSKKKGEKYFNDEVLLSLMDGQFEGSANLSADFKTENLDAVLKRLDELGVTVESKNEDNGVEETIATVDPMEAIRQAGESWRRKVNDSESSLSAGPTVSGSENKHVSLHRRTMKSYTDSKGNYHEGIEEELSNLEAAIYRRTAEENQGSRNEVDSTSGNTGRRGVSDLRKQAARLRAEIARRNQKKQEFRKKYNIDEKGNITLADLRRLFHELNTNKVVGKLFDKVADVLEKLGVDFRFTDSFEALTSGESFAFFNTTFFNWDAYTRNRTDQEKAKTILHEMIHNVAQHILERYEHPERYRDLAELTKEQKRIAQQLLDIFEVVKNANLVRKNGNVPRGTENAHEMLSEIADEEFRDMLDHIPYRDKQSTLQAIKEWFKDLLRSFGIEFETSSVLGSLTKTLDDILDTYDDAGVREYRHQRELVERDLRKAGLNGDIVDYLEEYMLNGDGRASVVEDEELVRKLESEPTITVYRAMQLQNGKLYPPMAAKVNGKWQDPLPLGVWSQADEHPELVDKNGKFDLDKGNGKKVAGVVYAPYMHGSTTMLNDQFKEAQDRPELVVVEAEMPVSELTSGYQAEKSPRKVGMLDWKAGTIQGQLTGMRRVMLSRWVKPVRIVPSSEVAASIKQMIDGQVEVMPTNVVTPEQREELEKLGVKFVKTDNKEVIQEGEHKGEQYSAVYGKKAKKNKKQKSVEGDPIDAIRNAAAKWAASKADAETEAVRAYSAKALYEQRINTTAYVLSEAFVDNMKPLDIGQRAIAGDKDIPDSQNAYMAENLSHGKNKVEQDAYNRDYREPLLNIINTIIARTGMRFRDIDRYVYTKSGLERNREFFVRDWLKKERRKHIHKYDDLNDAEQSIYDVFAARIEEDFEDGTIATEEEKNKKLTEALQKAHQEYVNQIEEEYQRIKTDRYLDLQIGKSPVLGMDSFTFPDYLNAIDAFIRRTIDVGYEPSKHDYSGFRAMYGDDNGKYDEAEIVDELMATEESIDEMTDEDEALLTEQLWERIQAATRYGLERYREAGMRSDEDIDRVEQMFHWYVPMRGFKEDVGEDMYQYFTQQGPARDYVGGLLKHAKGRGSEAEYPISTIFAMTYKAIADCNRNLVKQCLYRLCQANPNDLVILSDSWVRLNGLTGEWVEVGPEIPKDASAEEVRQITLAFEEEMHELALKNEAKKIKGKQSFDYKPMKKENQAAHAVDVRINGRPHKMYVVGNPRMAEAINGELKYAEGDGFLARTRLTKNIQNLGRRLLRLRQAVSTNYSLNFVFRNAKRDWTHFGMLAAAKEGAGYAKAAEGYYFETLMGPNAMHRLFKKYRDGTLDESKEIERDFKDFMDSGGITGFVFMQKADEIQREMESLTKKMTKGGVVKLNKSFWNKILTAIEAYNEAIENRARFATYRASRHYAGRTKARSAYDAKEITANYNRRGAGKKTAGFNSKSEKVMDAAYIAGYASQTLNANRMFFNATVQAIATLGSGLENADTKTKAKYFGKRLAARLLKYGSVPFVLSQLVPLINMALISVFGGGDDDDPYANLPEWVRRNNLCIYIGNGNFFTFALGQELAAFYSLGDIIAGMTYYPELKPVDKDLADELVGVLSVFSPVDMETKVTKDNTGMLEGLVDNYVARVYSNAAPLVQISNNISWTGRPIYKEDRFPGQEFEPEYKMAYRGTGMAYKYSSQALNWLGGGDDRRRGGKILGLIDSQINPGTMQYLVEQYLGGAGRTIINTGDALGDGLRWATGRDQEFNIRKIEGMRALFQQSDERTQYYRTNQKFFKYQHDANKFKHDYDIVNMEKQAKHDPAVRLELEKLQKTEEYQRYAIIKEANRSSKKTGKVGLDDLRREVNKSEGEDRRELQRYYNTKVKELVDELDAVPEILNKEK